MISVIVEDGTGVAGANSYVSLSYAKEYAANRGVTLPSDDELAAMLIRSTDYLEAQECEYQGKRAGIQSLAWPRFGVVVHGYDVTGIPMQLQAAQVQLAMAINSGFDLQPTISLADYVVREKVGPIETEYADPAIVGVKSVFSAVDSLLKPLFGSCKGFALVTRRV